MILKAIIDDRTHEIAVPDALLTQAGEFYDKLDREMAGGWQMSRDWVLAPKPLQRCQIVADKLLTALESENAKLATMMAGYLLMRLPGLESVVLDLQGEMQNHRFNLTEPEAIRESGHAVATGAGSSEAGAGLSKLAALEQAGNDVTKVFRVGRGYRYSLFDHAANCWRDSPLAATEQEASRLRQDAFRIRYEELLRG